MSNLKDLINQIQTQPAALFALIGLALLISALVVIKKVKFSTRLITQIAIMLALATVLKLFTIYTLPNGGSVTIGSMVPIILMALLYGPEVGLVTGFIFGIITLILEPFIFAPVQVLFDYPLAFMALGLAGYVKKSSYLEKLLCKLTKASPSSRKITTLQNILAALVGILGRFICACISGVVFFSSYAGDMNPYLYSIIYNGSYLGLDAIICVIILTLLPFDQIKKVLGL